MNNYLESTISKAIRYLNMNIIIFQETKYFKILEIIDTSKYNKILEHNYIVEIIKDD